jgi:putative ATP-dependent endonuclease of OLD family
LTESHCKILNQFEKAYAILHDADREKIPSRKSRKERANPAWSENQRILNITDEGRNAGKVTLLACVPNFEEAFFGEEAHGEKPYSALARLRKDSNAFRRISGLLDCLIDPTKPVPNGAKAWASLDDLKAAVEAFDAVNSEASQLS